MKRTYFYFLVETIANGNKDPTQCIALIKHEIYIKKEYVNIKRNPITLDVGILPMARLSSIHGASFSKLTLSPLKPQTLLLSCTWKASLAMGPHQIGVVCFILYKQRKFFGIILNY